jgi:hypothetical protein
MKGATGLAEADAASGINGARVIQASTTARTDTLRITH